MTHTKAWRLSSSSFYFSAGINHILVSLDFGTTLDGSNILKYAQNYFKSSKLFFECIGIFWNVQNILKWLCQKFLITIWKAFVSEQIWNVSNIQNFPKCWTWFIGNFSCKLFFSTTWDVPKQVPEHYEMFPVKQCPEYFRTFSNVLIFQYNFEMFFQSYLKNFKTNLKYF